jgi:hypothetical protein
VYGCTGHGGNGKLNYFQLFRELMFTTAKKADTINLSNQTNGSVGRFSKIFQLTIYRSSKRNLSIMCKVNHQFWQVMPVIERKFNDPMIFTLANAGAPTA